MRKSSTGLREISSRVLIFPYKFCMSVSGMILAEHRIQKWEHRWKRRQPVCAQVGQEERLQLQVTGSSWGISDGRAGHWWQGEQSVVTSTRDIRTLQPAVTFTLSSRLLTHWPHCQARWRSKGQQWSGANFQTPGQWSPSRAWPLMVINTRHGRSLLQMLHIALETQV